MFMIDQRIIPLDTPFTVGDGDHAIQYPANWLRLASAEEKAAIGITEVADAVRANDRFFWDGNIDNPKPIDDVRSMLMNDIDRIANLMLLPTDWKFVRQMETGTACDQTTLTKRSAIRAACISNKALVNNAISVAELASLNFIWPRDE
jgi:hypothetical protein